MNEIFKLIQLAFVESIIGRKLYRDKPEFCFVATCSNVNMRLFVTFVAIKLKAKPADSQNSGHALPQF